MAYMKTTGNTNPSMKTLTKLVENAMEQSLMATQLLFYLLGGLGIFFLGVGSLWFVSVHRAAITGEESELQ